MAGFPIFVDVDSAAPLVIGGSDLALSKVRLLLKRARRVDVAADAPNEALRDLASTGRVAFVTTPVSEHALRGRSLVISATTDNAEDERISRIARELGIPVNVPDRPHLCSFSLAAIVDRGTVTVAIGTEGTSPILATRIRAQLEQTLHPRLGRLAEMARDVRPAVAASVPSGALRRQFWERALSGPAADAILAGHEPLGRELLEAQIANHDSKPLTVGRLILVGAGPGDPDLLTLKAVRALKAADVILHDGLMGDGVLDHARREAQIISVAKAKGRHSRSQAEINAMIVAFAREGKTVVRLKGGDPCVFGRGGEEIETARASGIPVDVIPGITAATAVAASLQIPLTHRDVSRSVTFISGHEAGDGEADFDQVDFAALANGRATLAVYMGLSTAPTLAVKLITAGWSPTTPVLAVSRVSQNNERRIALTLATVASQNYSIALDGPTLLLIGEVASLDVAGAIDRVAHVASLEHHSELEHA
jgi:uroporphyrin-III C-methyltransferase / precorrin-2 dehydrogenase / sirohydrochlorin ferrochelatase